MVMFEETEGLNLSEFEFSEGVGEEEEKVDRQFNMMGMLRSGPAPRIRERALTERRGLNRVRQIARTSNV